MEAAICPSIIVCSPKLFTCSKQESPKCNLTQCYSVDLKDNYDNSVATDSGGYESMKLS